MKTIGHGEKPTKNRLDPPCFGIECNLWFFHHLTSVKIDDENAKIENSGSLLDLLASSSLSVSAVSVTMKLFSKDRL